MYLNMLKKGNKHKIMEEKLLKIFKLMNKLNDSQNNVYTEISYSSYKTKKLEISIRDKKDFSYISVYRIELFKDSTGYELDNIIRIFESYVGGIEDE